VRAVVANIDEATFVVNTDGRIVRTNEAAQRLLGDVVNDRVGDVFDCDIETLRRRDVVENAVEHNDAPEPHVAVRGERIDRGLRVTVADDGPGIPNRNEKRSNSAPKTRSRTPVRSGCGERTGRYRP
jgi:PAS domain-containing protein